MRAGVPAVAKPCRSYQLECLVGGVKYTRGISIAEHERLMAEQVAGSHLAHKAETSDRLAEVVVEEREQSITAVETDSYEGSSHNEIAAFRRGVITNIHGGVS